MPTIRLKPTHLLGLMVTSTVVTLVATMYYSDFPLLVALLVTSAIGIVIYLFRPDDPRAKQICAVINNLYGLQYIDLLHLFRLGYEEQSDDENHLALGKVVGIFLQCKLLLELIEPDFVTEIFGHKTSNKRTYKFAIAQATMDAAIENLNALLSITEKGDTDRESSRLKLNEIISSTEMVTHILDELVIP